MYLESQKRKKKEWGRGDQQEFPNLQTQETLMSDEGDKQRTTTNSIIIKPPNPKENLKAVDKKTLPPIDTLLFSRNDESQNKRHGMISYMLKEKNANLDFYTQQIILQIESKIKIFSEKQKLKNNTSRAALKVFQAQGTPARWKSGNAVRIESIGQRNKW